MQLNTARCDLTDLSRLTRAQRQETHHQSLITNGELYLGNIFSCLKIYASYCLVCEQPESLLQLSHNLLRLRPRAVIFNTARIMRQGSLGHKKKLKQNIATLSCRMNRLKLSRLITAYIIAKTCQYQSVHVLVLNTVPRAAEKLSHGLVTCYLLVSWSWCHLLVTTPRTDHLTPHTWHGNNISSFTLPQFPHMLHTYSLWSTIYIVLT